jgi:RND superfamily putative drug exporter
VTTLESPPVPARTPSRHGWLFAASIVALVVWLVIGAVGSTYQSRLAEVQENDNAAFLPDDAESTTVLDAQGAFSQTDENVLPAVLVIEGDGPLTPDQLAAVEELLAGLPDTPVVVGEPDDAADRPDADPDDLTVGDFLAEAPPGVPALQPVPSEDGEALIIFADIDFEGFGENLADGTPPINALTEALRAADDVLPDGVTGYVAGPVGSFADLNAAFEGIDGILLAAALLAVLVILVIVYRSPLLPLIVILCAVFALLAASTVVFFLADSDVITLNGQAQGILSILVVGATVDYALLLTARYREELRVHDDRFTAMVAAWKRSLEPILASGATVVLGLLCLLLSDLGSNRALGPVAATGIVFSVLAALTFLPAMLLLPMVVLVVVLVGVGAGVGAGVAAATDGPVAVLAGVGALVGAGAAAAVIARIIHTRRQRARDGRPLEAGRWVYWPGVPHVGSPGTETAGVWARVARLVGRHPRRIWVVVAVVLGGFSALLPQLDTGGIPASDTFTTEVESITGQEALARHFPAGADSPAQVLTPVGSLADTVSVIEAAPGVGTVVPVADPATGEPVVVEGRALVEVVLADKADSDEAKDTVRGLREDLDAVGEDVLVGGDTAINVDLLDTAFSDLQRIVPAVLVVILIVLSLLLRALVAPVLIIAANVLSFAATLGISGLAFEYLFGFAGSDPSILLFGFVFLVALGIDYSIFLMTRVREESVIRGTRPGILVGLAVTGGVITSAGIVLAATFASLATLPIVFLAQIAFIVAFGVLLDTFIVRSLLLPALSYDIGRRIWWPHRLSREPEEPRAAEEPRPVEEPAPVG